MPNAPLVAADGTTMTPREYRTDVYGRTPDDAAEHRQRFTAAVERVNALEDDSVVRIVADEHDVICSSCIFAKHCSLPTKEQMLLPLFRAAALRGEDGGLVVGDDSIATSLEMTAAAMRRSVLAIRDAAFFVSFGNKSDTFPDLEENLRFASLFRTGVL